MRLTNEKLACNLFPIIVGAACMMTMLTAVNGIADLAHAEPRVGDIVAFTPSANQPAEAGMLLAVHRPNQFGCILDLKTIRQSGGSLFVERELAESAGSFRVHWAGQRTSGDAGNCGNNSDLILDAQQLGILASAAAG